MLYKRYHQLGINISLMQWTCDVTFIKPCLLSFLQKPVFKVKSSPPTLNIFLNDIYKIKILGSAYIFFAPSELVWPISCVCMCVCLVLFWLFLLKAFYYAAFFISQTHLFNYQKVQAVPCFFFLVSFWSFDSKEQYRKMGPQINFKTIVNFLRLTF